MKIRTLIADGGYPECLVTSESGREWRFRLANDRVHLMFGHGTARFPKEYRLVREAARLALVGMSAHGS